MQLHVHTHTHPNKLYYLDMCILCDYKDVVVAIDGSVFRFHPHFPNIMKSRISQLMGIDYKFDLMLSEDGSGRGAALVAAVLKRGEKEAQSLG